MLLPVQSSDAVRRIWSARFRQWAYPFPGASAGRRPRSAHAADTLSHAPHPPDPASQKTPRYCGWFLHSDTRSEGYNSQFLLHQPDTHPPCLCRTQYRNHRTGYFLTPASKAPAPDRERLSYQRPTVRWPRWIFLPEYRQMHPQISFYPSDSQRSDSESQSLFAAWSVSFFCSSTSLPAPSSPDTAPEIPLPPHRISVQSLHLPDHLQSGQPSGASGWSASYWSQRAPAVLPDVSPLLIQPPGKRREWSWRNSASAPWSSGFCR